MGVSLSTIGGWGLIASVAGYYVYRYVNETKQREISKNTGNRQRLDDRSGVQNRKDGKEKAKRQRVEAYSKDVEDSDKTVKAKNRAPKAAAAPAQSFTYSSDDATDNKEFARQFSNVQQGTALNGTKKNADKKQKSVKQSRAREANSSHDQPKSTNDTLDQSQSTNITLDQPQSTNNTPDQPKSTNNTPSQPKQTPVSSPSSTAGVDADDDESDTPVPEQSKAAGDAGDVSDMLEPKAAGPSMLRITGTDKVQSKEKKVKAPEQVESKKQRQNRRKAEAEKIARDLAERERKSALEAQRRLARISEGRPAKDGSAYTAQASKPSVWTGNNGVNGTAAVAKGASTGQFMPVQPLDTAASVHTDASASPVQSAGKASWMDSLPSEEEQMQMLRQEEQWNTVTSKKMTRTKSQKAANKDDVSPVRAEPQASAPVVTKTPTAATNGKSAPTFSQLSSFAALSTGNDVDKQAEEEEWDV